MAEYDDESKQEYSTAMAEYGFDEMEHEEGLDEAIDALLNDLEGLPDKIQQLVDYLLQGYDLADAAYYAGYGNDTQGLHKVLRKDTGQGTKDKLKSVKDAHSYGKTKADERVASRADA